MKPVVLIVLDGLGHREEPAANAVELAHKSTWPRLLAQYPKTLLHCSGLSVGLPEGQMGNSEVGHTILGGGRIVYQDLVRISKAIADGDFFENPELVAAVDAVKASGGTLHLLGLNSPGGIHSTLEHGYALCELAKRRGVSKVAWHA
ncbi:MAG TPA: 2,3-bisphosphoglycerate-independent phosphoglycerate mutase, partial [Pseudomonadota bacterium]|nr:2,3-bisphosphoglycerate-independent phosphoglycerate mutase [Pseudomonadota bacterium]